LLHSNIPWTKRAQRENKEITTFFGVPLRILILLRL
jgi:hypothetical protein